MTQLNLRDTSSNPYTGRPDYAFWRRSVSRLAADDIDPIVSVPFQIGKRDAVATAGSCFAQHISRTLAENGFNYLITEREPLTPFATPENYGVYPARIGNVYSARQLLQLFDRAYGLFEPLDSAWNSGGGRTFVDPFRPQIQKAGYPSAEAVLADREEHFKAVRRMFERCDVFIFTLGLTEAWRAKADGAIFPIAPGVAGGTFDQEAYEFCNFSAAETTADLRAFLDKLRVVNPDVAVIFTVSPVPLIATYVERHVLVSTIYSKAVLRVAAEEVCADRPYTTYFPSYEIITGPPSRGSYFEADCREVTPAGVAHVMSIFQRHFLTEAAHGPTVSHDERAGEPTSTRHRAASRMHVAQLQSLICDEEALDA